MMNCWPPFWGTGISVNHIAQDWKTIRVITRMRWYNRNYVKSHYGGNLFSMTDPFYMLMLLRNLGADYVVWDTTAKIKFIQPGRSDVTATFVLTDERLCEIRKKAESGEKLLEKFRVDIVDDDATLVASVMKTLYIRKKSKCLGKCEMQKGDGYD